MEVRFWGTRGSIPASLSEEPFRQKVLRALKAAVEQGIGPGTDLERFVDKGLCLFHLDSALTDEELDGLLNETNRFAFRRSGAGALKISMAWDGMILEV
jgi:hypothetical protein